MKSIMSVKEAGKLLGKDYENLDDEKIAELVEQTHDLAKLALDVARKSLLERGVTNKDDIPNVQ